MVWFIDEILELVIERIPRFTLTVIGTNPPPKITRRSTPRVRVLGHVPDLTPYLCNNRVSIAPLRFGAGIKGKITQSLATGLPVIATRVAVEGMPLQHATSALIADEPSDFAANLVAAHSDRELWRRLAKNGLSVAANHYGPESARPTITQLVDL
jgi:glycosyltransferase involved in cell wall biosynthesis